ncbi:TatD family hydrolase, partial [Shewanella sp. A25]|nr:TatD family hydrolase [Shewanella shenzhenensis]
VDSHCHLDRLKAAPDEASLNAVLTDAAALGISHFLCVNVRLQEFEAMQQRMQPYNNVFLSAGVHPLDVENGVSADDLRRFAANERVVAIGE